MVEYYLPFKGKQRVTNPFGIPGSWKAGWHIGVDMVGDDDKTVLAIADGVVESINAHGSSYGNHIVLKHADNTRSLYAHLASVKVKKGTKVKAGTAIGVMGATGNASGAHLHLEVHNGAYKYPSGYTKAKAKWILDPCDVMGIPNEKGEVDMKAEITKTELMLCGKKVTVNRILQDGKNYVELRSLECEEIGIDYDAAKKLPVLYLKGEK